MITTSSSNVILRTIQSEGQTKDLSRKFVLDRPLRLLELENAGFPARLKEELSKADAKIAADYESSLYSYLNRVIDLIYVVSGFFLIRTVEGAVPGISLITTGVVNSVTSLVDWEKVLDYVHEGDAETKKRFAMLIPFLIRLVSITESTRALVHAGMIGGQMGELTQKIKQITTWASAAIGALTGYGEYKVNKAQIDQYEIDGISYTHEQIVKKLTDDITQLIQLFQKASSSAKKPVKQYFQDMQMLTKRV